MSEGPFICYKELVAPTNVERVVFFSHYNSLVKQHVEYLCILSISVISVYEVVHTRRHNSNDISSADRCNGISLKFHQKLFGKVNDIKAYRNNRTNDDMLVLSIDVGKIVILDYNVRNNSFDITLMCNVEENSIGIGSEFHFDTHGMRRPLGIDGRIDICQENALICSVVYGKYLLFIPMRGLTTIHSDADKTASHDYDEIINTTGRGLHNNSHYIKHHFTVDIAQSFQLFGPIIDICFVRGYSQPAMAILQQSGMLPVGHTAKVRHTSTVTVLAVDTLLKSTTILWQKAALPSDSISILQLSSPVFKGAIAVITLNALLLINQQEELGLATNGFAGITVHKKIKLQSWLDIEGGVGLELDASKWIEDTYIIASHSRTNTTTSRGDDSPYQCNGNGNFDLRYTNSLLGILKDGTMIRIGMSFGVANDMLSSITFHPEILMNTLRLVTCLSLSTYGDLLFIGSRQVECLLVQVTRKGERGLVHSIIDTTITKRDPLQHTSSSFLSPTSKKKRSLQMIHSDYDDLEVAEVYDDDDNNEWNDEDLALYSDGIINSQIASGYVNVSCYDLMVIDSIPCIGPILHGIYTTADAIFSCQHGHLDWNQPVVIGTSSSAHASFNALQLQQSAAYIPDKEAKDGLIVASGLDDGGSLLRVHQGLRLEKLTAKSLVDATHIFSIPTLRGGSCRSRRSYGVLLVAHENKTRVLHCQKQQQVDSEVTDAMHMARGGRGELQLKEMPSTDCGFHAHVTTLNAGILFEHHTSIDVAEDDPSMLRAEASASVQASYTVVAQISPGGVHVVRLGTSFGQRGHVVKDVLLCDSMEMGGLAGKLGERIIAGDVCQGYIIVVTSMHSLYVLSYNSDDDTVKVIVRRPGDNSSLIIGDRGIDGVSTLTDVITSTVVVSASLYRGVLDFQSSSILAQLDTNDDMMMYTDETKDNNHAGDGDDDGDDDIIMYGRPLSLVADDGGIDEVVKMDTTTSPSTKHDRLGSRSHMEVDGHGDEEVKVKEDVAMVHLIVTDDNNQLYILRMDCHHITCVFQSNEFAKLKPFVANRSNNNGDRRNSHAPSNHTDEEDIDDDEDDPLKVQGLIVETRCTSLYDASEARFKDVNHPTSSGVFTITLLLHTGDLVVYSAMHHAIDGSMDDDDDDDRSLVIGFQRIDVRPNTNKKSSDNKLFRSYSNDTIAAATSPNKASSSLSSSNDFRGFLNSNEYLLSNGPSLAVIDEINGRSAVLVTGNEPLIITSVHGLPTIFSIGLPEIPCINYGMHVVIPFSIDDIRAIAGLWIESEDIQSVKNPTTTTNGGVSARSTHRECLLGIYQQLPSLELYPHSNVSIERIVVGKTVHKIAEVLNKTGDRTQQALLEKKTIVMLCSEETQVPFLPSVLTDAEIEEDGELYERYFTTLDSFSPPDASLGLPPCVIERQHSLTMLQLGGLVDTYWLPRNESVVDMEVLYFNLHKSTSIPGMYAPLKTLEQRVYVAACTTVIDKRGEDTQGKGRLLLFGIDYALFEADDDDDEVVRDAVDGSVVDGTKGSSGDPSMEMKGGDKRNISMAQAKFLGSIKPKLRLLWSGTGPASIVRQLGEYVLTTVGSIVYVYKFNPDTTELEQVAFYYAQIYITTVSIIKNYIVLADMHHSIQFLVWRAEDYSLNFVSKDYDRSVIPSSGFIVDGNKLAIVVGDDENNIQLFQENPRKIESIKGTRLLCTGDFHLGSEVTALIAHDLLSADNTNTSNSSSSSSIKKIPGSMDHRPPPPPPRTRKGSSFPLQRFGTRLNKTSMIKRTTTLVCNMDGGIGIMLPLEERMYKRLILLQQIMTITIPTLGGLNPRDYSLFKSTRVRVFKKKGVLDGCVLWCFLSLPPSIQNQLAATVGATAYLIKENLHEVDYLLRFF